MMPIKEVRWIKSWNGREYKANICIDKRGRECVSSVLGYSLVSKDGKRETKREADWR